MSNDQGQATAESKRSRLAGGWGSILGQERTVAALRRAVREERPNHAYLLLGAAGSGKLQLAEVFAQALVCESGPSARPCGECNGCRKVAAGTHPDVWCEEPSGKSDSITADQITELQRRLSFRRAEGRARVIIIDRAGSMNSQAQNRLLKTLEEPPPETVLVLCAAQPGQLLITVRSRCQKVRLGAVPATKIEQWLVHNQGVDPTTAAVAAASARGLPGRALELTDSERAEERQQLLAQITAAVGGRREAIDELCRGIDRDRKGCSELLTVLQELLRDAMMDRAGAQASPLYLGHRIGAGLLKPLSAGQFADRIARVERTRGMLHRNVSPAALLEDLLVYLSLEAPKR